MKKLFLMVCLFSTPVFAQQVYVPYTPYATVQSGQTPDYGQQWADQREQAQEQQRQTEQQRQDEMSPGEHLVDCGQTGSCAGAFSPR